MELYNIEAEQIILGSIIQNNEYFFKVTETIKANDFYEPVHQELYKYLEKQITSGEQANSVNMQKIFNSNKILKELGGQNYLGIILGVASGIFDIPNHAREVLDLSRRRRARQLAENLLAIVNSPENNSVEMLDKIKTDIENIQDDTGYEYNVKSIYEIVSKEIPVIQENMQNKTISRLRTGLKDFDEKFHGLKNGELTIFGGRPSMGKSTIASQIGLNIANSGKNVIFFSEEMSNEINAYRTIANITRVNSYKFEKGFINETEFKLLEQKATTLKNTNFYIDDRTSITPAYMEKTIRRLYRKLGRIDLVIIDYLQFTKADGNEKDIRRILSDITKKLKGLAKKYDCPVLCLSQLNREVDKRDNKRPEMFDLRDSGTIEEDADMVVFCYRAEYYEKKYLDGLNEFSEDQKERKNYQLTKAELERDKNTCELIVRKNRNGACGTATIKYLQEFFIAF